MCVGTYVISTNPLTLTSLSETMSYSRQPPRAQILLPPFLLSIRQGATSVTHRLLVGNSNVEKKEKKTQGKKHFCFEPLSLQYEVFFPTSLAHLIL